MNYKMEEYKKAAMMMPGSVLIFQLTKDNVMKVIFYSKKAQELTGMDTRELDGNVDIDGFNMILKDDHNVIIAKIKEAIAKNEELDIIYRQPHKSQGFIWVHMRASIVGEQDGLPVFLATMLDVTNEMLNSYGIMDASESSICVIEKATKLLLYANSKFYNLIGRKPGESMGVYCYDALCGNKAFKTDNSCLCFSTINISKPFEYYNPETKQYLSMYGREIKWGEHEAYVFFISNQTEDKFKEKQLKNAQERFEMTLDNSDLFVWEYDMVNNQCLNPQKAVREYGLPPVIDNYPESLYDMGHTPPETVEQIKEAKRRLLAGETDFSMERRTINTEGKSQWMKVTYSLEKDSAGNPIRALVCGLDITAQKEREAFYQEEINRKKNVASDSKVMGILNLTTNTIIENDAESKVLQKIMELGNIDDITKVICEKLVYPEHRAAYMDMFSRDKMLAAYGQGHLHGSIRHMFTHRDGWYESAYDLIQNPTTGDIEAVVSMKDVTRQVRTEQVVKKLAQTEYDNIYIIDIADGRTLTVSHSGTGKLIAVDQSIKDPYDEQLAMYIKAFCVDENLEEIYNSLKQETLMAELQKSEVYTGFYTLSIGGKVVRKRNMYTYLDKTRRVILCARQDITEIYNREEEQKVKLAEALKAAEAASVAKTDFLSRVSHDMRTPLNGILGLTTLLEGYITDSTALRDLSQLEQSGRYLLNLINDTLDVSKIESGKVELNPSVCDGRTVLKTAINLIMPNIRKKDINFKVNVEDLPYTTLYIDSGRLQQIFMNIVGNAVKFTPKGGTITFTATNLSVENGVITDKVVIQDTGLGMSEEFLPHLFEPFSQERNTATSKSQGTGLGMTITKEIVELMGGKIYVESELGKGTTFTLILPLKIATAKQAATFKEVVVEDTSRVSLNGVKVLLCEDHPLNAIIATRLLEKKGVNVEWAENGEIGVNKFIAAEPGYYKAILMDIRMPVMNGIDATKIIRDLEREDAQSIPIIAMTANALSSDMAETKAAGMNAHLSKPIDANQLYEVLQHYVGEHPKTGEE